MVDLFRRPFIDDSDREAITQALGGATVSINGVGLDARISEEFGELDLDDFRVETRDIWAKVVAGRLHQVITDPVNCAKDRIVYVSTTGSTETIAMKIWRCEPVGNGFFMLQLRPDE